MYSEPSRKASQVQPGRKKIRLARSDRRQQNRNNRQGRLPCGSVVRTVKAESEIMALQRRKRP